MIMFTSQESTRRRSAMLKCFVASSMVESKLPSGRFARRYDVFLHRYVSGGCCGWNEVKKRCGWQRPLKHDRRAEPSASNEESGEWCNWHEAHLDLANLRACRLRRDFYFLVLLYYLSPPKPRASAKFDGHRQVVVASRLPFSHNLK